MSPHPQRTEMWSVILRTPRHDLVSQRLHLLHALTAPDLPEATHSAVLLSCYLHLVSMLHMPQQCSCKKGTITHKHAKGMHISW